MMKCQCDQIFVNKLVKVNRYVVYLPKAKLLCLWGGLFRIEPLHEWDCICLQILEHGSDHKIWIRAPKPHEEFKIGNLSYVFLELEFKESGFFGQEFEIKIRACCIPDHKIFVIQRAIRAFLQRKSRQREQT